MTTYDLPSLRALAARHIFSVNPTAHNRAFLPIWQVPRAARGWRTALRHERWQIGCIRDSRRSFNRQTNQRDLLHLFLEKTEEIIQTLSAYPQIKLFLFGGGTTEIDILSAWAKKYPQTISVAGKLKMEQELALMSHLDAMLTMDSGNMHLASLVNIPVISVWGATHPYAGFMGWNQSFSNVIQTDLPCRPCSIYGNKPCKRKDYACLNRISPAQILSRIAEITGIDLPN